KPAKPAARADARGRRAPAAPEVPSTDARSPVALRAQRDRARRYAHGGEAAVAFEKLAETIEEGETPRPERIARGEQLLVSAEARDTERRDHLLRFLREKASAAKALGDDGRPVASALTRLANQIERGQAPATERSEMLRKTSVNLAGVV